MRIRETIIFIAVLGALLGGSASASAADFTMKFDSAVMQTGWRYQTPGANSHDDVPVAPDDAVVFSGSNDDGAITIPADGVKIKDETVTIEPSVSYFTIEYRATTPFTGVFNSETGQLDISGTLEQTVRQGTNVCTTGPINVDLSTETSQIPGGNSGNSNTGVRFVDGLEGPGRLTVNNNELRNTSGVNCDRENLNCYARTSIAGTSFSAAFATSGTLIRGVASIEICDPPGIGGTPPKPTAKPRVQRTQGLVIKLPKSNVISFAQITCPDRNCQVVSAKTLVKVRGRRYRSRAFDVPRTQARNVAYTQGVSVGTNARKHLTKGVKSGSATITIQVESNDDSVAMVEKTIKVGLTR